jgi:hypothetical protein
MPCDRRDQSVKSLAGADETSESSEILDAANITNETVKGVHEVVDETDEATNEAVNDADEAV